MSTRQLKLISFLAFFFIVLILTARSRFQFFNETRDIQALEHKLFGYFDSRNFHNTVETADDILEIRPENTTARLLRAETYRRMGHPPSAYADINFLINKTESNDFYAYYLRAVLGRELGKTLDEICADLDKAVEMKEVILKKSGSNADYIDYSRHLDISYKDLLEYRKRICPSF